MGMIGLLVALHPRAWRERYGDEFAALLEDTGVGPRVVVDVVGHALALQARAHLTAVLALLAVVVSVVVEVVAVRADLTDNILWAPSTPARAVALAALLAPWVALVARRFDRRRPAQV